MIGLGVPGQPIGPWSRRTGAPKASAIRRDRINRGHIGATCDPTATDNTGK